MNALRPHPPLHRLADRRASGPTARSGILPEPLRLLHRAPRWARPAFFWENYGHWCFTGFKDVNALLRDKRFGREILHVVTREELGWPPPKAHTAAFDLTEKYSLLALEPPAHTRLRTLVNRAFVSRHVEQLRPRIERAGQRDDRRLRGRRRGRAAQGLRGADPGHRHRRDDRRCRPRWRCSWSIGRTAWCRCTCSA